MPAECLFCDKLGRIDQLAGEELVWQFPHSVALLGPWQYYHGYCVLISRLHRKELSELAPLDCEQYLRELCLLARAIARCFRPRKLNYELLGNQVPHLHWHLFPRYESDPEKLKPVWIALDRAERDENERRRLQTGPIERAATSARIRAALEQLA
jgi:diadenosine tetraphosphate (Ap4A) HIT family hydrolase